MTVDVWTLFIMLLAAFAAGAFIGVGAVVRLAHLAAKWAKGKS